MSGAPADQDNSIEEILASIRQIISEDDPKPADAPAPAAAPATPVAAAPEPEPAPVAAPSPADDVFELVDRVVAEEEPLPEEPEEEEEEVAVDMVDAAPEPEPEPEPAPVQQQPVPVAPPRPEPVYTAPEPISDTNPIFGDIAAAATTSAFAKLSDTILVERQRAIAGANVTLEDIVKDLLSPILRQWVDAHVPAIVERLVQEELEKLARQAREG